MNYRKYIVLPAILLSLCGQQLHASDLQREKRMADEIVDAILDGEAVFLQADDHEFLSIYTAADEPQGVAIILHGRGFHPDWQDVINPLRVGLVDAGWSTLSVQMPVLEKQAKYYDYLPVFAEAVPRIDAAIEYARGQAADSGADRVVLIAHSCGAHMAMAWVEENDDVDSSIDAYVGIGMGATDYRQPMLKVFPLDRLTVPILDVYGENDYPAVLRMAVDRLDLIETAGNKKSDQVIIRDADHYYVDKSEELTEVISQWLKALW